MNFLDSLNLNAARSADRSVLSGAGNLDSLPPKLKAYIAAAYEHKSLKVRLLGAVLNSIFTELKGTFLFSRRSLLHVIKHDVMMGKRKTISGSDYSEFWSFAIGCNYLKIVRQPVSGSAKVVTGPKGKKRVKYQASVLQIAWPELVEIFDSLAGAKVRALQEQTCIELFDSFTAEPDTSKETSHNVKDDVDNNDEITEEQHSAISETATPGGDTPSCVSPVRTWGVVEGDDRRAAVAIGTTNQIVMLDRLIGLIDSNEVRLTDYEVKFVTEVRAAIGKHYRPLSPKRERVLLEIWKKTEDVRVALDCLDWSNRLFQFCKSRLNVAPEEIKQQFLNSFGEYATACATDGCDVASTLYAARYAVTASSND